MLDCRKVIEVFYDVADIPGCNAFNPADARAFRFREAAMNTIGNALSKAGLGKRAGAQIGASEFYFGFVVTDFDAAEQAIWQAVEDTPYAGIRELVRYSERVGKAGDFFAPQHAARRAGLAARR